MDGYESDEILSQYLNLIDDFVLEENEFNETDFANSDSMQKSQGGSTRYLILMWPGILNYYN